MKKKLLASILAIATLVTCIFSTVTWLKDTYESKQVEQTYADVMKKSFSTQFVNTPQIKLMSATPMTVSAEDNTVSQTLVATVYPSTATNKAVDWSVAWADSGKTEDVETYVTVTPTGNGSNTATVTCYKAFAGNIIVTATTRESGYTADCIVTFVGIPTDMTITSPYVEQVDGYHLGIGNAYTFNVEMNNPFGSVGKDYQNVTAKLSGVGSMILSYKEYYVSSGTEKWYDTSDKEVTLDSLKDNFITVDYSDGVLTVNTLKSIESYYESVDKMDAGRTKAYTNIFRSYVSDCYFTIELKEETSGVTETIKIRFDDTAVAGVEMENEMYF